MKVVITGGAGYIGSHCNRYFNQQGIETIIVDNLCNGNKEAIVGGKLVVGDFGDRQLMNQIFQENKIDAVIHFAAHADVNDSVKNPSKYYENNVTNMISLLDAMVENNVNYIVFSSSAAIFGEPQYIPIDEAHQKKPINPYGMTKLIGERILNDYERAYGLHYCALRYFNAAGASSDGKIGEAHHEEHHLIPLIIQAGEKKIGLKVYGNDYDTKDGSCLRDYIHVEDLTEVHYKALNYIMNNQCSECFNLGNNSGYTVLDVINEFMSISDDEVEYKVVERRSGDPAKLVADNRKAKSLLNWDLKKSELDEILRDAYLWEKNRTY